MGNRETDRSNIIFGTVLICLGILFLLNTFNLISWHTWNLIIRFWPLILVIIGLNILLKRSKLWWIVPIIIIVLFVTLIFGSPESIRPFRNYFSDKEYSGNYSYSRDIKEELDNFQVDINYKAGVFVLSDTDDEDKLCNANLTYYDIKPEIDYNYKRTSRRGHLTLEQQGEVRFNNLADNNLWKLKLSREFPLSIIMNAGAGKIDMDISNLKVSKLNVNAGVGDLTIEYNDYDTESTINSGAANIKLYIPSQTAVKITTSAVLNNNNFEEAGLIKLSNKLYQSENIGEAEHRVNIDISTSASNIDLIYR